MPQQVSKDHAMMVATTNSLEKRGRTSKGTLGGKICLPAKLYLRRRISSKLELNATRKETLVEFISRIGVPSMHTCWKKMTPITPLVKSVADCVVNPEF